MFFHENKQEGESSDVDNSNTDSGDESKSPGCKIGNLKIGRGLFGSPSSPESSQSGTSVGDSDDDKLPQPCDGSKSPGCKIGSIKIGADLFGSPSSSESPPSSKSPSPLETSQSTTSARHRHDDKGSGDGSELSVGILNKIDQIVYQSTSLQQVSSQCSVGTSENDKAGGDGSENGSNTGNCLFHPLSPLESSKEVFLDSETIEKIEPLINSGNNSPTSDIIKCGSISSPPISDLAALNIHSEASSIHSEACLPSISGCQCCERGPFHHDFQDTVTIQPCSCVICPECALRHSMNRKFTDLSCPSCDAEVDCLIYGKGQEGTQSELIPVKHKADKDKDPCRYFMQCCHQDESSMENKAILSLTTIDAKSNKPEAVSAIIDLDDGPETENDEAILINFFTQLHHPLFSSSSKAISTPSPQTTIGQVIDFAAFHDESLLLKLLFALASGKARIEGIMNWRKVDPNDERRWSDGNLSRLVAVYVAKEMLTRVTSRSPGKLQYAITHLLEHTNASAQTREILSRIRLSASPSSLSRDNRKAWDTTKGLASRTGGPLDLWFGGLDNIGFKRQMDYLNWTLLQGFVRDSWVLKKLGFYQEPHISREGVKFEDFLNGHVNSDAAAETVVGIRDSDLKTLSCYILTHLSYRVDVTYEDCIAMIDSREHGYRFAPNLGLNLAPQTRLGIIRDKQSRPLTIYERNRMTLDIVNADPSKKADVMVFADFLENISDVSRNTTCDDTCGEKPINDMGVKFNVDGSPCLLWYGIRDKDIEENGFENRRYKKAAFLASGFHTEQALLRSIGRLSRGIYIPYGIKWRRTEPMLNWVLCPHDTNECKDEYIEFVLAHYHAAATGCAQALGLADGEWPSNLDIHHHMLKRAKENPTVLAHLKFLRDLEVSFMMRDSEKSGDHGDAELFMSALRLSGPIFATSNATGYAKIACEMLEYWQLASPAERVLFENFYFTMESQGGKPWWRDRGMEKSVMHVRDEKGKHAKRHFESTIKTTVAGLPFRVKSKTTLVSVLGLNRKHNHYSLPWNKQRRPLSKIFALTFTTAIDWNIWGTGPLTCPAHDDDGIDLVLPDGDLVSSQLLNAFSIGKSRMKQYYIHDRINTRYKSKKTREVSLKVLPSTSRARKDRLLQMAKIRMSTSMVELHKCSQDFPIKKVKEELNWLKEVYPDLEIPKKNSATGGAPKREDFIRVLCEYRQLYFEDFPGVKDEYLLQMEQLEQDDVASSLAERTEILDNAYFALVDTVKEQFAMQATLSR